jgi:hypothetical protein
MASGFSDYLRSDTAELELSDVLRQPTTKLLGVSADAGTAYPPSSISVRPRCSRRRARQPQPAAPASLPAGTAWRLATG